MDQPSIFTETDWIDAVRKSGDYPKDNDNRGKWILFIKTENADETWAKIKQATEDGKLGNLSRVSTAKPKGNLRNPATRVIVVFTYDWTDANDVRRVREELRQLGFVANIPYKAHSDTLARKYANKGDEKISKYYE